MMVNKRYTILYHARLFNLKLEDPGARAGVIESVGRSMFGHPSIYLERDVIAV